MSVKIKLFLHGHCIETEAGKELKRLMDIYFTSEIFENDLEARIELLQKFLEKSNFSELRSSDLRLSGIEESAVIIYEQNGKIIIAYEKII